MPSADHEKAAHDEATIRRFLTEHVAERCGLTPGDVDPDRPLAEIGLASRDAVAIVGDLEELVGRALPAILLYEYPTIARLAHELARLPGDLPPEVPSAQIAVVGLGCRLPGGIDGPEAFWRFLLERGEAIGQVPEGRWESFTDDLDHHLGGFLDDVAGFDSRFFGITPDEADAMDPQQRLLLEVAWEALEHAGIAPVSLRGSRTGVFVGISAQEYALLTAAPGPWTTTGGALSIAANRLSYLLDLRGPSMSVDTACSSSLVAVHLAVRSLCSGESDLAVAGGVNVLVSPMITMTFNQAGGIAPDGRCKAFDASADGMVRAEGCGVVVLKRLGDAHRDGDRVLAVINNTAVNSDGRSNGLVAPNPDAQEALLREAWDGLEPPDYVEAHGTGTLLGDPIEAHALGMALGRNRGTPLLIGSVKTNLGHLESAAGVAALIKTVLALKHRTIPASLHYHRPNPHIDFTGLGLAVVAEQTPWPPGPARAGVSSFGFGGTNAHVALEAAPFAPWTATTAQPVSTLLLSDVSADRIAAYAGRLAAELTEPAQAAYTLARRYGRGRFGAAIVGRDRETLAAGLRALAAGHTHPSVATGEMISESAPVWVLSGYAAARPGTARRLLTEEPAFSAAIERLEPLVQAEAGFSLWDELDGDGTTPDPAQTMITLFGVQLGLARLWQAHGAEPAAVIGHSMGEVAAAVVAGALCERDGVTVIARRSHLLKGIAGGGAMAVLGASEEETAELSAGCPDVHVAVLASPRQTVITGDTGQIATVMRRAERNGLLARLVRAEGAGHSPQVEPLLGLLRGGLSGLRPAAPCVAFYSTTLEDPRRTPAFDADYWAANLRNTVRLAGAVRAAAEDGHRVFVEVSPHPLLTHALAETAGEALVLHTLRREAKGEPADDTLTFHRQLAAFRISGPPIRPPTGGRLLDLPPLPWRHEHHWSRTGPPARTRSHPLLGVHVALPGEHRHAWSAHIGEVPLRWRPLHRVSILPAAAYAEIALQAGAEALGTGSTELTGLRVERLLPLDEHTTIATTCTVEPEAAQGRVEVHTLTPSGAWTTLATATVRPAGIALAERCRSGGRVAVPPAERSDRRFRVHPVVLDRCLSVFGPTWTPVSIGSLRVPGRTDGGGSCEFEAPEERDDGSAVASLRLTNDAGTVLLAAREVELRRIPATAVPVPLAAKLVEAAWIRTPPEPTPNRPSAWLVISDPDDEDATAIAGGLADTGCSVVRRPLQPDPCDVLGSLEVVVVVPARLTDEALLLALSALVRALSPVNRLWIATRQAVAVRPGEAGEPGHALVRALTRVLGFEQPALRATVVDVDDPADAVTELLAGSADSEIAWRDGERYAARLQSVRLGDEPPSRAVRPDGAYLISGGYGGLGLVTARRLAGLGARRLVLCGRSGPRPDAQRVIDELRAAGTEVEVVLGDIAAPDVAERMVAAARRGGLRLRGVIHAAGGLDDRFVTEIGPEDAHRVWAPKVEGALRLHEATRQLRLDWWVVYSSAAALLGSLGQGAYAAANARVDALVDWRRAHGLPASTINWGPWAEVGGAAGLTVAALDPLTPEEGADALEALLAHDRAATGVIRFRPDRAVAAFPEIRERRYFAGLVGTQGADDDDWPGPEALRDADPRVARHLVGTRVRRRASAVLGFAPDPARPLTDLGLDSLIAVRIKSALEHDLGVMVPASDLLSGLSLAELEARLCRRLGIDPPASPAATEIRHVLRPLTTAAHRHRAAPESSGPLPFFCAHPAGGGTDVYRQLAALLGEDLPFYGLDRLKDVPELEERATRYVAMIRAIQPQGPYRLGGWSFGGVLAHEIARQIGAADVELVALLDAGLPKPVENRTETTARRYADFGRYLTATYGVPIALRFEELAALEEEQQLALVIERTKPVMEQLPPAVAVHQFTSHHDTRVLERYRPGPYDGRVVLYRSTEPTPWAVHDPRYDLDEDNGFAGLCPHLEIVPVPRAHHLNLLDPPAVRIIADHLGGLLTTTQGEVSHVRSGTSRAGGSQPTGAA